MRFIITGASGGLGTALVKELLALSHDVIAVVRNKQKRGKLLESLGFETGDNLKFIYADLAVEEEVSTVAAQLIELGIDTVDGIVHNAAVLYKKAFSELSKEEIQTMFQVNLFAPILLTRELTSIILKSDNPMMIFISSMAGIQGADKYEGLSIYGTTKAGLIGFAEQMYSELEPLGVRILSFAPGAIKTSMLEEAFPGYNGGLTAQQAAGIIVQTLFDQSVQSALPIPIRADFSDL